MSINIFGCRHNYGGKQVTAIWFVPGTHLPETPVFKSRGLAPNAGSGPYFCAFGKVTLHSGSHCISDEPVEQKWTDSQGSHHMWVDSEGDVRRFQHEVRSGTRLVANATYYERWEAQEWLPSNKVRVRVSRYVYNGSQYVRTSDYVGTHNLWTNINVGTAPPIVADYMPYYNAFLAFCEAGMYTHMNEFAAAYLQAAQSLPQADVNLIGNIKEAIEYIHSGLEAIKDPTSALSSLVQTATNPKDLWLQYRYVYKTNQMDAKELEELVGRIDYLTTLPAAEITSHGYAIANGVTYGVSLRFPVSSVLPDDIWGYFKMFGARVTPSNIWDLVPYSFMVDWFAHVGDKLKFIEDWAGAMELQPKEIWFTVRAKTDSCSIYYRISGKRPLVPPLYEEKTASGKTVLMRVADTISIFT